jgi:hypothetical protein
LSRGSCEKLFYQKKNFNENGVEEVGTKIREPSVLNSSKKETKWGEFCGDVCKTKKEKKQFSPRYWDLEPLIAPPRMFLVLILVSCYLIGAARKIPGSLERPI